MQQQQALTITGHGFLAELRSVVDISMPLFENSPKIITVEAIWDTGATGTVITKKVVDALGLKPIGMKRVETANGSTDTNSYLVDLYLPNKVVIQNIEVLECNLSGMDVLIGMDIIRAGDFAITNCNNRTVMSFRIPSCEEIDYVKRITKAREKQFVKNETKKQKAERRTIQKKNKAAAKKNRNK